jgi:hypothetical protein
MSMTWSEFKRLAEEAGITNEMEISYIDVSDPQSGPGYGGVDFFLATEKEKRVICQ